MRVDLDSKRRIKRRQKVAIIKILVFAFVVAGIASGFYSVPRYPQINISSIDISGNEIVSKGNIEQVVKRELQGSFNFFFPKGNIFWYPKNKISSAVLSIDPHIESVNVSFINFQTIGILVSERAPQALWCGSEYVKTEISTTTNSCYFLDKTGFIFAKAPDISGSIFVHYYGSTTEPVIGRYFVKEVNFKSLAYVTDTLKKAGYPTNAISVAEDGLVEAHLEQGGKILLTQSEDFGKQLEKFKTLINSKDFKGKDAEGKLHFNYIDVRFGNKVFFKL